MECPHCVSLTSKVVDSRLTSDRVSIRRRRECLLCLERFTTYESTEERMLPVLIKNKVGHRSTKTRLKTLLPFISETLKDLSNETKKLVAQVDMLEMTQAAGEVSKKKASPQKLAVRKTAALTTTDVLLKIIRRYKKGVGISTLKTKTGFDDKKISNAVHRAVKQGKVRRVGRGVYIMS
jgi:transcriptional regulator NrdR family protein